MAVDRRLVVVSNRLPVSLRRCGDDWQVEASCGGLATAMAPVLRRTGGIWLGWPGASHAADDSHREAALQRLMSSKGYHAVELPHHVAELYYEGFANQVLWPLFHHFPSRVTYAPEGWRAYVEANQRFRDAAVAHIRSEDLVWIHDYHLMLLPQLIREAVPDARIGFFLHIPFPSSEVFRILPRREELLRGVLGADLVAFQTHSHLQHFRSSLLRVLGIESRFDRVEAGGRDVRLEALPIGIAPAEFTDLLDSPETIAHMSDLRRRFSGRRILLAVDRLDYTKGIPERLRAYRRLLETAPELRTSVVLIQIAVPSREAIRSYGTLRGEVDELVGSINGQFGTPDWTPVLYIRRPVPRSELVALYAVAEVGWVSPLRDGMNLVAKEYVACQRGRAGILILSEFAGAAAEMGEAFSVNPYDEERTASVLERALKLPEEERRERMSALYARVARNNVFAWSERFTSQLSGLESLDGPERSGNRPPLSTPSILQAYRGSRRRSIFLDYDGTLVPYRSRPEQAVPSRELSGLLQAIASDAGNTVVLVSGRKRQDIETWFGDIENLWLAAEHGALVRPSGTRTWEPLRPYAFPDWKPRVEHILNHFVDRTPGSFIEEKEYSLVWHYRMADPEFGEWLANELAATLEGMLSDTELRVLCGRKVVEVKPLWINKGEVCGRVLGDRPNVDFCFAAGDDHTDEDLFERLPPPAWTTRIGIGTSAARFSLAGPTEVLHLLDSFAGISAARTVTRIHWSSARDCEARGGILQAARGANWK